MPKVTFVNEKKEIEVPEGAILRDEALKAGIEVYKGLSKVLHCPGWGLCGTCRVLVTKGMENLNGRTVKERIKFNVDPAGMFAIIGHENEMRLSCQVQVNGDCSVVTTPAFNWSGDNFWQKPYPNK